MKFCRGGRESQADQNFGRKISKPLGNTVFLGSVEGNLPTYQIGDDYITKPSKPRHEGQRLRAETLLMAEGVTVVQFDSNELESVPSGEASFSVPFPRSTSMQ